jgi:hypothetical protein
MVTSMPSQRPELKTFMKIKAAKAFSWPKHSLMGDEHKSISKLAHHFQVEHNRCIYQAYFEGAADGYRLCESIKEALDLYEDFYCSTSWRH